MSARTIGFDLDGVLARPATYFFNLAAMTARGGAPRRAWHPEQPGFGDVLRGIFSKTPARDEGQTKPESPAGSRAGPVRRFTESLRYAMRWPMPDALEVLQGLQPFGKLILVTNRNTMNQERLERWLTDKGLRQYLDSVHLNDAGEPGTHFKLRKLGELGAEEYVEDNPEICDHLARGGIKVYFRKWAGVKNPSEPSVTSYRTARELIDAVTRPVLR